MNRDIAIPDRMAHLPLDRRGYPIPFNVLMQDGKPFFTINDSEKAKRCIAELLCPICGGGLEVGDMWWVGGPMSAFHPHGAYIDSPMHYECSTYALEVCPHLAAPNYTRRIDVRQAVEASPARIAIDHTVLPERPLVFVQACSVSYSVTWPFREDFKLFPCSEPGPPDDEGYPTTIKWLHYEVWQHGRLIDDEDEGLALIREAMELASKQQAQKRRIIIPDKPDIYLP